MDRILETSDISLFIHRPGKLDFFLMSLDFSRIESFVMRFAQVTRIDLVSFADFFPSLYALSIPLVSMSSCVLVIKDTITSFGFSLSCSARPSKTRLYLRCLLSMTFTVSCNDFSLASVFLFSSSNLSITSCYSCIFASNSSIFVLFDSKSSIWKQSDFSRSS